MKALLVEHKPGQMRLLRSMLSKEHGGPFTLEHAQGVESGIEKLSAGDVGVVLLDLDLPGGRGMEAFARLRSRDPRIPIILLAEPIHEDLAAGAIRQGAQDYLLTDQLERHRLIRSIRAAVERKQWEQRLEISELRYRRLFETAQEGILVLYADTGKTADANPFLLAMTGYSRADLVGRKFWEIPVFRHPEEFQKAFQTLQGGRSFHAHDFELRHRNSRSLRADMFAHLYELGGQKRIQCHFHGVARGEGAGKERRPSKRSEAGLRKLVETLARENESLKRDISERAWAEEALGISKRIVKAQEEERRWVARELHDSVSQILSSAKFRIQSAEGKLPQADEPAAKDIVSAKVLLDRAIQEIRRISHNLRPTLLGDLGLVPALRGLCDEFVERTGKALTLKEENFPKRMASDIELAIYRIVQEALTNIVKHSGADRMSIRLGREEGFLRIQIKDNGRGFDAEAVQARSAAQSGLGLIHIRERAEFLGGSLSILSAPGKGAEMYVRIPFERRAADLVKKT